MYERIRMNTSIHAYIITCRDYGFQEKVVLMNERVPPGAAYIPKLLGPGQRPDACWLPARVRGWYIR